MINFELSVSLGVTVTGPIYFFYIKKDLFINLMNLVDCFGSGSKSGRIPEMSGMTCYLKDN